MANAMKERFRTVAKVENRQVCPRCPVVLERAVFVYDYELGNKLIQFVLRNVGTKPVTGAVVRFRCYDGAGNCLYPGSAPDSGITYSGLTCRGGEYFADRRAVKLWSYDIVNYDAWVTQVTFADGTSMDLSPNDYIERPARALLAELLSESEEKAIHRAWGKRARCVPIAIDASLWMCSCGRVCIDEVCRDCGAKREAREPYFGSEATAAYARSLTRRRGVLRGVSVAVVLIALLAAGAGGARYAMNELYPAATREVTEKFLAEGRYDEALGFLRERGDRVSEQKVLVAARDAALEAGDFETALLYDSIRETPEPELIYRAAATQARAGLDAGQADFTAAGYGLLTTDEALYDALIHELIEHCEANSLWRQAARYTRMLHDMNDEALAEVFDDAVANSMARESYAEALSWAEQHPDSTRYDAVLREIFDRLFAAGDLEQAMNLSLEYETEEDYLGMVMERADDAFVAEHIGTLYFAAFDTDAKREWNARRLALGKEVAYIDAAGTVKGLKGVNWQDAVSLSTNDFHTLCLFSDGRVEASGNTGYGRCSVSSWSDVVAVAAGERHSVGLRTGGRLLAVGDNNDGQCDVTNWTLMIGVAAGKRHTVGLRADGTVRACGSNASGQCAVEGYDDIIKVTAGDWTTVLLHRDGSVTVLGNTALGIAEANSWTDIVDIAAGSSHVLGLRADGTVLMAGQPTFGSAGSVEGWSDITDIAAGSVCIAALKSDGTLLLSGDGMPAVN